MYKRICLNCVFNNSKPKVDWYHCKSHNIILKFKHQEVFQKHIKKMYFNNEDNKCEHFACKYIEEKDSDIDTPALPPLPY